MKKILSFLLVIVGLYGYSQDEYYRIIDWKFYPENVIQLTDSTYLTDAYPFDYNDVGAIQRVVGNYVVDFVGHRYSVIDSTSTTITVLDIYHIGQAPQTGQIARCYRSVGNGEAEYIGSIDYSPLDESSRWKLNGSDNELLWRQTLGKAENGLYKDLRTAKLGGDLIEPTTIDQDNNSFKILNNGHGSVFSETGIAYTKIDTALFGDSTLITKMYANSRISDAAYSSLWNSITTVAPSKNAVYDALSNKVSKVTSTDNAIVRFDGTGGNIQNSGAYLFDSGNFYIGSNVENSYSRMFIYGGANGANIDVRGSSGMFTDQATIELMGNDYETNFRSTYLQYKGSTHTGTTLGYSNANLAQLVMNGETNLIYSSFAKPIIFGTNNQKSGMIDIDGKLVLDSLSSTSPSIVTASTTGKLDKATFTTMGNSGAATFSLNNLNIPHYTLSGLGGEPLLTKGNLTSGSSKVTIGGTGTNAVIGAGVSIDINEANIVHQNLSGHGTNTHAQIDTHITNDLDLDPNNEIQDLSLSGNTLSLSGDPSTVDLSGYEPAFSKNTAFNKNFGTTTGTVLQGRTFGTAANNNTSDFAPASGSANYIWNGTGSQPGNFNITGRGAMGAFDIGSYGYQQSRIYGGSDLFFLTSTSGVGLYAGGEKLFFYNGLGGLNILELDRLTNSISVPNGSINTGGNYLKNSTTLLLDWLKSGSAPASGNIVVGNGSTTNPSGVSVNQAIGGNTLTTGWVLRWDGTKFVNFYNPAVQTLTGTTPTLNASNGVNANISISGATTLTLSNLISGTSGTIYLTNNASVYRIKIAGYTIAPASNITYDSTGILLPASSVYTHTSIGWYYNGTTVQIHKADYNTTTY